MRRLIAAVVGVAMAWSTGCGAKGSNEAPTSGTVAVAPVGPTTVPVPVVAPVVPVPVPDAGEPEPVPPPSPTLPGCSGPALTEEAQRETLVYAVLTWAFDPANDMSDRELVDKPNTFAMITVNGTAVEPQTLPPRTPRLKFTTKPKLQALVDGNPKTMAEGATYLRVSIAHASNALAATVSIGPAIQLPTKPKGFLQCCCTTALVFERTCKGWKPSEERETICS